MIRQSFPRWSPVVNVCYRWVLAVMLVVAIDGFSGAVSLTVSVAAVNALNDAFLDEVRYLTSLYNGSHLLSRPAHSTP